MFQKLKYFMEKDHTKWPPTMRSGIDRFVLRNCAWSSIILFHHIIDLHSCMLWSWYETIQQDIYYCSMSGIVACNYQPMINSDIFIGANVYYFLTWLPSPAWSNERLWEISTMCRIISEHFCICIEVLPFYI